MGADSISAVRGRYLIFQLADRTYAIPVKDVEEIIPVVELCSVPGAPAFLLGFLDCGGQPIAVISLHRLLGLQDHEWELYTPLVIIRNTSPRIAIEIDSVTCIAEIREEHLVPLADGYSLNDVATAAAQFDGHVVVLLSPQRILLNQEQKRIDELAALAQQRINGVVGVTT